LSVYVYVPLVIKDILLKVIHYIQTELIGFIVKEMKIIDFVILKDMMMYFKMTQIRLACH